MESALAGLPEYELWLELYPQGEVVEAALGRLSEDGSSDQQGGSGGGGASEAVGGRIDLVFVLV